MLTFPSNVRLYLATGHTDLRRSFHGLSALVEGSFGLEARSGDLFIFLNRRCTQVRILFWERDGDCILMKRLKEGSFCRARDEEGKEVIEIDAGELAMMLEGIDAPKFTRRKRYKANAQVTAKTSETSLPALPLQS